MEETRVNITKKVTTYKKESKLAILMNQFILHPFLAGISGFTVFFLSAIFLDFIVNVFSSGEILTIDIFTVLIGLAGFILAFGFSLLESTQK
ncbi:MAG: hypothetical protein KDC88_12390 [Ignavibacteriae bacterium]|nr:hypothetical protein [Ignavibacteriota bacterium]MCB9206966.1 hypothetical protein [Ignavibacteriales bacterium]MCB9210476.1 hypothetical protein [Ignavibacteriales bacterium]MCB9219713.1 hypothetical protein [Ignavibacteriales bacterium]